MTIRVGNERPLTDPASGRTEAAVLRVMVGAQLRRFREAAGLTPDEAAYEIRGSRSKISRIENGRVAFKTRDVRDLLTLYGVTDEPVRRELLSLTEQANAPGWWSAYSDIMADWFGAYLGRESAASLIRTFDTQALHGLCQTEGYARAMTVLRHPAARADEVDRWVSLQATRQELLDGPDPPQLWSVVDEASVRRNVGGPRVMRDQLGRLLELAGRPGVTVQVMPLSAGGYAAACGGFTALRFAQPDLPDAVYLQHLTSAACVEKRTEVERYLEVLNILSARALSPGDSATFLRELIRDT